jgi:hypothetical protein
LDDLGVNERFKWVLEQLEEGKVFVYVTRGPSTEGGLALALAYALLLLP